MWPDSSSLPAWAYIDPNQANNFIFYGMEPHVGYEFRISAYDASDSKYTTSAESTMIVAQNPKETSAAGSPTGVRVDPDNNSGIRVNWKAYTAPTGRTVTGIQVELKSCSSASMTSCDGGVMTAWVEVNTVQNSEWDLRQHRFNGLTDGRYYTARAAARTYETSDTTMTTSDAWSVWAPAARAWSEPTQIWFIDDTPNANSAIGRTFMMTESNKTFGGPVCHVSSTGGSDATINCPVRTLVSLDAAGVVSVWSADSPGGVSARSTTQVGNANGPPGFQVRASAGAAPDDGDSSTHEGRIVLEWDAAAKGNATGDIDAYVVQRRKQNTDGTWPDWPTGSTVGANLRSSTFGSLADGTYQVRARSRIDGDDKDPMTTDTPVLGFTSEILTLTVNAAHTEASTPLPITLTPGSKSLYVEWELPESGSIPYAYEVRWRPTGPNGWEESAELRPRITKRFCNSNSCSNPRNHNITQYGSNDLIGGRTYEVQVRALSANGWSDWVGRTRRPNN